MFALSNFDRGRWVSIRCEITNLTSRVLELKNNLRELESSPFYYVGTGLTVNNQTYDPEMNAVPKTTRLPLVKEAIETAFQRVQEKRDAPVEPKGKSLTN